jgi:hypothetical protein
MYLTYLIRRLSLLNETVDPKDFDEALREVIAIARKTFTEKYNIDQTVRVIGLVDEDKKYLNGSIGNIDDIYIGIDKNDVLTRIYKILDNKNDRFMLINEKNIEPYKEKKYKIVANVTDDCTLYVTSICDHKLYTTLDSSDALIISEEEIGEITTLLNKNGYNLNWNFKM